MDLHPLFVHFPIALLSVYTFFEVIRLPYFKQHHAWFYVKACMVIFGTLGAFISLQSGEVAAEAYRGQETLKLIQAHSNFANLATWLYGVLAVSYLVIWLNELVVWPNFLLEILARIIKIVRPLSQTILAAFVSALGFFALLITGALGAALVYGKNFDPMVRIICDWLVR